MTPQIFSSIAMKELVKLVSGEARTGFTVFYIKTVLTLQRTRLEVLLGCEAALW